MTRWMPAAGRGRLGAVSLAIAATLVCGIEGVVARAPIRQSFFNAYPSAVGSRLDNLPSIQGHCGVCHYQFTGAGPRNPYGQRIEGLLGSYPNNDAGRQRLMHDIENEDADADGYAQITEITDLIHYGNTPTFPGLTPSNVGQVSGVNAQDILAFLVPAVGGDVQAPTVNVISPNGGESWQGGTQHTIAWTATDDVGVISIDVFYRATDAEPWTPLALSIANAGTLPWFVHNTPGSRALVLIKARDAAGNVGQDLSNAFFTITRETGSTAPTTLRDFEMPGTHPLQATGLQDRSGCSGCHGGYDPAVEPEFVQKGSMMAQAMRDPLYFATLVVAEQDASSSGDLCLRCHTPLGWLSGRSNPTDGSQLTAFDRDGVTCDFCHRGVDPSYVSGQSPSVDLEILAGLDAVPPGYSNGMYVIDPQARRRGPFADVVAPHPFLVSPFHVSSNFCGTCHDVSNPVFEKVAQGDYAPGPLDQPPETILSSVTLPVERTYSEWLHSEFPGGVYAPEFAGNKPGGYVSTCQDCHMRDVNGKGANDPNAPIRPNLPLHDQTGGNSWVPTILDEIYPNEVDPAAQAAASARAVSMLQLAALLDLTVTQTQQGLQADCLVTNRAGHKLPTGYPEGRRMWIQIRAYDGFGQLVYQSGAYDPATGVLIQDADAVVYEAKPGLSGSWAGALGLPAGPSFHFALNDSIYKDNRIPPRGFTNAGYATFGGEPVDPHHEGPGPRYADGQNFDVASYLLPASARKIVATLFYQT
ncbi:MAG: hypothetical protein QUU85_12420, partial [Candidatus Eisenbacteria bacterium]|nr:hypothetical protein [Candidatus Eisenbacteria bacterium]